MALPRHGSINSRLNFGEARLPRESLSQCNALSERGPKATFRTLAKRGRAVRVRVVSWFSTRLKARDEIRQYLGLIGRTQSRSAARAKTCSRKTASSSFVLTFAKSSARQTPCYLGRAKLRQRGRDCDSLDHGRSTRPPLRRLLSPCPDYSTPGRQTVTSSFLTVAGLTGATDPPRDLREIARCQRHAGRQCPRVALATLYGGGDHSTGVTPIGRNPANDGLHLASFRIESQPSRPTRRQNLPVPANPPSEKLTDLASPRGRWDCHPGDRQQWRRDSGQGGRYTERRRRGHGLEENSNAKRTHVEMV